MSLLSDIFSDKVHEIASDERKQSSQLSYGSFSRLWLNKLFLFFFFVFRWSVKRARRTKWVYTNPPKVLIVVRVIANSFPRFQISVRFRKLFPPIYILCQDKLKLRGVYWNTENCKNTNLVDMLLQVLINYWNFYQYSVFFMDK